MLKKKLGPLAKGVLILTALECKGLEFQVSVKHAFLSSHSSCKETALLHFTNKTQNLPFQVVLISGFFSASPARWKLMYQVSTSCLCVQMYHAIWAHLKLTNFL